MSTHSASNVIALAAGHHGIVDVSSAIAVSSRATVRTLIRNGTLTRLASGILVLNGAPPTWRQEVAAAVSRARGGVASMRAACRLFQLDAFDTCPTIDIMVERPSGCRVPGAVVHRVSELDRTLDVTVIDGIPVTSVARTLCDLGAVATDDQVEQALDEALRLGYSLRWISDTLGRLHRPGPSGTHSLQRVLALPDRAGELPGSWRERVTQRILADRGIPAMVRQFEIRVDDLVIARPDLAVVEAKVGIEFHSKRWHSGPRRERLDLRRHLVVEQAGWELVYLNAEDHRHPDDAAAKVLEVLRPRLAA